MNQILSLPSAELTADFERSLLCVSFRGDVKFDEYKKALLGAAELVRSKGVQKVIMDRRKIEKVDAECRVWAKNEYVKVHIKPLIPKLTKVAVVDSKSIVGQLYGKAIYQTLSIIYPTLAFKFFNKLDGAMKWLEPSDSKEDAKTVVSKDRPAHQGRKSVAMSEVKEAKQGVRQEVPMIANEEGTSAPADDKVKSSLFEKIFNILFPKFG